MHVNERMRDPKTQTIVKEIKIKGRVCTRTNQHLLPPK